MLKRHWKSNPGHAALSIALAIDNVRIPGGRYLHVIVGEGDMSCLTEFGCAQRVFELITSMRDDGSTAREINRFLVHDQGRSRAAQVIADTEQRQIKTDWRARHSGSGLGQGG